MTRIIFQKTEDIKTVSIPERFEKIIPFGSKNSMLARCIVCEEAEKSGINDIRFGVGEYGKPFLLNTPEFHFNISHTKDAVAVAISGSEVGIDIEAIRKEVHTGIIEKYFTTDEKEYIGNSIERFTEIWCCKEAYLKCLGSGINDIGILRALNVLDCPDAKFSRYEINDYCVVICEVEDCK